MRIRPHQGGTVWEAPISQIEPTMAALLDYLRERWPEATAQNTKLVNANTADLRINWMQTFRVCVNGCCVAYTDGDLT